MIQRRFGSLDATGRKLEVIQTYLEMYQKALTGRGFHTVYLDAFSGTGEVRFSSPLENSLVDGEVADVIEGSAVRAAEIDPPFSELIFVEKSRAKLEALESRFSSHRLRDRMSFSAADANIFIQEFCRTRNWRKERAVVFLDPFGSQVRWETIQAIADTRAIDLWYLFPAGLSVFRQIGANGVVDETHEPSVTRLFGTEEWKSAFLKPSAQSDLFGDGEERFDKTVTPESAAGFMIERMKTIFRGGVLDVDHMVPLGKLSYPSFYLLFAWANPSEKARPLANKLSKAAIKAIDRKHGRLI